MTPEIKVAIEKGSLMLLFGAGASQSSKDKLGREILNGNELANLLAEEAALPYADESLPVVYAAAKSKLGDRILPVFEDRFRHCKPSAAYKTISQYVWPRIYTLNIDDAFETAARATLRQQINVRHRNDRVNDRDPFFNELDIIKLNGSADRLQDGLIFSPQEYGAAAADTPFWYQELGEEFFRYTFLFIGTRLSEPLFYHQIERYRRAAKASEGKSFVLTREATEIERAGLAAINLQHVTGTIENFAHWLGSTFPSPKTPWEIASRVYPQLRFMTKKADPAGYVNLFQRILLIGRKELASFVDKATPSKKIRDFYRGFKPTWADILNDVPARLKIVDRVAKRLDGVRDNELLFVLYGPAGSGKLTALMQLALEQSQHALLPVYFLTEPVVNTAEILEALEESNESRYFFFVDRLSMVGDSIHELLLGGRLKRAIIVATERQNVWNSRTHTQFARWCAEKFPASEIDEAEATKILEKLERFGPWTRLAKMKPKARKDELLTKAKRQLLIGLLETTSGLGFEKIIENDYNSLTDADQKKFVVLVSLGSIHRLSIPEELVSRALPKLGVFSGVPVLLGKTSGIIHRDGHALFARHPVYVEHLFEGAVTKDEKAEAIHALLDAFTVYAKPLMKSVGRVAGSIFKLTLNHGFLRNTLQADNSLVLNIYESFSKAFQEDALFWLQYGLALREAGQQDDALERLKTARDAYPIKQTEHAYAQQQLIIAQNSASKVKAYTYLEEAKETLTRLDSVYEEGETDYPMVTLSEHHTKIVAKFEGTKKARELARDYANLLEKRIKQTASNPRLKRAWKTLATYATTGNDGFQ